MSLEPHWPLVRDMASFGVGVYVVVIALRDTPKDPVTLAFGAGLMGIPAILGAKKT